MASSMVVQLQSFLSSASKYSSPSILIKYQHHSQPFWGNMVAAAGVGPRPIDHKNLSMTTLSNAIRFLLHRSTVQSALQLSTKVQHENGVKEAVKSFHRNLPVEMLKCDMLPRHPATWCWIRGKRTLRLSHRAAGVLVENKKIEASSLRRFVPVPPSLLSG